MGGRLTTMEAVWQRETVGGQWEGSPEPRTSMGNRGVSRRKGGRGRELTGGNSTHHDLRTVPRDNENDGDVVPHVPIVASAVGAVPTSPAVEFREVGAGAGFDCQNLTTIATVGAAVVVGGPPSRRLRLRRRAPTIPRPDPKFEPVVGKRRAGSISTLTTPAAAVSPGIVVFVVVVVGGVVVEERERRRCGGGVVVGGGKQANP